MKENKPQGGKTMLFICYPKCSTCQKAQKWLAEQGVFFEIRDIKENPPTAQELSDYSQRSGLPLKKFFNTSGMRYRDLGLKEKLPAMTDDEQLELLASDGMLVKRPLLVLEDQVLVGFRQTQWEETLGRK
jgi:arsenate reductase